MRDVSECCVYESQMCVFYLIPRSKAAIAYVCMYLYIYANVCIEMNEIYWNKFLNPSQTLTEKTDALFRFQERGFIQFTYSFFQQTLIVFICFCKGSAIDIIVNIYFEVVGLKTICEWTIFKAIQIVCIFAVFGVLLRKDCCLIVFFWCIELELNSVKLTVAPPCRAFCCCCCFVFRYHDYCAKKTTILKIASQKTFFREKSGVVLYDRK